MIRNSKIILGIKKFINLNNTYSLLSQSAEISFYMITSALSMLVVLVQILNSNETLFSDFLFSEITKIFSESFLPLINQMIPKFKLSGFSIIIFINIIWASSAVLNKYNKIADRLYTNTKRNFVINRINSILLFAMLLAISIFYLLFVILLKGWLDSVLFNKIKFANSVFSFLAEISFIFLILLIIYINAPPIKMKATEAIFGSLFSALLIYTLFTLFTFFTKSLAIINPAISITFVLSFSLLFLFCINYLIILGLLLNYLFSRNWNELIKVKNQ